MKKSSEIKIKYKKGLLYNTKEYKEYEYDYVSAATAHTKRFNSAVMLLMGIDGCEHHLMDWIADHMTEGNYITNNSITRESFIKFHDKWKKKEKKPYTDNTVRIAFQKLAAAELLVPVTRGTYIVNPKYYFKSGEEDRIKAIRMIMECKAGVDTKITVEVTEKGK